MNFRTSFNILAVAASASVAVLTQELTKKGGVAFFAFLTVLLFLWAIEHAIRANTGNK